MNISSTRPPWLPSNLEPYLQQDQFSIPLYKLRCSRHDCPIVAQLLSTVLQELPRENPSEYELSMARQHLAVELQGIMLRWIREGMERTLGESFLGGAGFGGRMDGGEGLGVVVPMKRPSSEDGEGRRIGLGEERDFRCPYHVRDPSVHPECEGKRFPNPRKLKEHIWRFTKPFKCPTCSEGFGREKTKAIHCEQRKVKCVPSNGNSYKGSIEQARDLQIERAKSTTEIIGILEQFDREKIGRRSSSSEGTMSISSDPSFGNNIHHDIDSICNMSNIYGISSPDPDSPPSEEESDVASFANTPINTSPPWAPASQRRRLSTVSPPCTPIPRISLPQPFQFDALFQTQSSSSSLEIPDIVVTEMNPVMHSPMVPPGFCFDFPPAQMGGSGDDLGRRVAMRRDHLGFGEGEREVVRSSGFGSFGPFSVGMKF